MNSSISNSNAAARRHPILRCLAHGSLFLALLWGLDRGIYEVLSHGLNTYYGLNKDAQVLCLGYSHTVLGIDAEHLEQTLGVPVAKYATSGANTVDRFAMVKHYLKQNRHVKLVTYDVDARLFDSDGLSSASYSLFLPFIDDPSMSRYLQHEATPREYRISKLIKTARFRDQTLNIALRGLLHRLENEKRSVINKQHYQRYFDRAAARGIRINQRSVDQFHETIQYLSSKEIKVLLVYVPVMDLMYQTHRDEHQKVVHIFEQAARNNPNVYFINYNKDYSHQHELFFDPRHLNQKGKLVITSRLSEDVKNMFRDLLFQIPLPSTI